MARVALVEVGLVAHCLDLVRDILGHIRHYMRAAGWELYSYYICAEEVQVEARSLETCTVAEMGP
jgi:hypothetical protein